MKTSHQPQAPIAVIGGGVIGLAVGWQLLRRGRPVRLFERGEAGREASWAAAGMLAPHSEVGFEDDGFLALGLDSLRAYRQFLSDLSDDSARRLALDDRGTLIVAFHRDDAERIRRLYDFRRELGLPVEWRVGSEVRDIEPALSPRVMAAIWIPDDSQVNNRELVDALREAFIARGGELREHTAVRTIDIENDRVVGVRTDGGDVDAGAAVIAAGCWSRDIGGIPDALCPAVRPVKGQIVSLGVTDDISLAHVIRAPDVYLMPKNDGRLVVGATQEEMGFDKTPTAGPVMRLLERAWEAVPSIYDLPIEGIEVGLRPGSRDHQPIVGDCAVRGLYFATGHFRHGILLAPLTAQVLTELIVEGKRSPHLEAMKPTRFATVPNMSGKDTATA